MRSKQQRRDDAWDQMVSDIKLDWRSRWSVLKAETEDRGRAIDAGRVPSRARHGDLPHLLLTILTGGAWAPVWLFVWWRNDKRINRIAMGPNGGKTRRRVARTQLKVDQRAARAAIRDRSRRRVDVDPPTVRIPIRR